MNYKTINIGLLIKKTVIEKEVSEERILKFTKINALQLQDIYNSIHINTDLLLKFSKILDFDFFRIYSQHIILYSPISKNKATENKASNTQFRKNLYTKEIIDFVLEQIKTEKMTKKEVMVKYNIPKTTLYKWISKYQEND